MKRTEMQLESWMRCFFEGATAYCKNIYAGRIGI